MKKVAIILLALSFYFIPSLARGAWNPFEPPPRPEITVTPVPAWGDKSPGGEPGTGDDTEVIPDESTPEEEYTPEEGYAEEEPAPEVVSTDETSPTDDPGFWSWLFGDDNSGTTNESNNIDSSNPSENTAVSTENTTPVCKTEQGKTLRCFSRFWIWALLITAAFFFLMWLIFLILFLIALAAGGGGKKEKKDNSNANSSPSPPKSEGK